MGGAEPGVEPAVEAHLQDHARILGCGKGPVGVGEGEGHRLLAEDRLAGLGCGDDEVGMRIGGRGDHDRVDGWVVDQGAWVDE